MKSVCTGCGEIFTSLSSFDKHRVGSFGEAVYVNGTASYKHKRRCMSIEEMLNVGMRKHKTLGYWTSGGEFDMSKAFSKKEEAKV